MSEAELIKFVKERIDAMEEAHLRLEASVRKDFEAFGTKLEKCIDKLETDFKARLEERTGDTREHGMRISTNATAIEILNSEIRSIQRMFKRVWAVIGPLIVLAAAALVKLFWNRKG